MPCFPSVKGSMVPTAQYKILLVDDDIEFAKVTRFRLTHSDKPRFEVHTTSSLKSALELFTIQNFDLILLDLLLPDAEGIQAITQILAAGIQTPVVIMTGLDNDQLAVEAVRKGAQDYIVKGETNPKMLIRIIQHAIDRHSIRKKLSVVTGKLRQVNAQLEKYAVLDPLTDAYNRRGLQQILTREIHSAERKGTSLLALVMDIDDFKKVNDTLGHPCGDIVIKEVAKKIKDSVRISDYIGRIGGDEFVLLLPETNLEEGVKLAERLRLSISNMHLHISDSKKIRITVSIGLAPVSLQVISVDEILGLTDPLLMESKNHGKNQVFYEHHKAFPGKARLSTQMPDYISALRRGEHFFAVKQPIHDLRDSSITGFEFLTRMHHHSFNMPNDFFKAALENNMITLVDHHCFNTCVAASNLIPAITDRHINLLPSTIMDIPARKLIEKLSGSSNYCIEISEQQILGDSSHLAESIQILKRSGVKVAMDDVGFGNTCLENLFFIEPDILKIDKKCVMGISYNLTLQKTLCRILKIAEDLKATVIAEGIETREDLETLLRLGVQFGQGYYLSMPA